MTGRGPARYGSRNILIAGVFGAALSLIAPWSMALAAWTEAGRTPAESATQSGQNDTTATAAKIPLNQSGTGFIGAAGDVDYYKFTISSVTAPDTLLVVQLTAPSRFSLAVTLGNPGNNCTLSRGHADGRADGVLAQDLTGVVLPKTYCVAVRAEDASASSGIDFYTLSVTVEQPAHILGQATVNGSSDLQGIQVSARGLNRNLLGTATTNALGAYAFPVPANRRIVGLEAVRYAYGCPACPPGQGLGLESTPVDLTLAPGASASGQNVALYREGIIAGTIGATDGPGLDGVDVAVLDLDGRSFGGWTLRLGDPNFPRYRLGSLPAGTYTVIATRRTSDQLDYAPTIVRNVQVTDGLTTPLDLHLTVGRTISGSITPNDRQVCVRLLDPQTGNQPVGDFLFSESCGSGSYRFEHIPDGTYRITTDPFSLSGFDRRWFDVTVSGAPVVQNIILTPTDAMISGRVTNAAGLDPSTLFVFALPPGSLPFGQDFDFWSGTVHADLTYTIPIRSGQRYQVGLCARCGGEGGAFIARLFDVPAGTSNADLAVLTGGHRISGRVIRAADGFPPDDVDVIIQTFIAGSPTFITFPSINDAGEYRSDGLVQDGTYQVIVRSRGGGYREGSLEVTVGGADLTGQNILLAGDPARDRTAPAIGRLAPFAGASVNNPPTTIQARLADHFSAIDSGGTAAGGIATAIDGSAENHTKSYDAASSVLTLTPSSPLAVGSHTVRITASDSATSPNLRTVIWTFAVDTTPPTGSVVINSGKIWTNTPSVTLTLACADVGTGCVNMQVSNDGVFDTEPWEPFTTTKSWTLLSGNGARTVHARYQDGAENFSVRYSDAIKLDTSKPQVSGASDSPDPFFHHAGGTSTIAFTVSDNLAGTCKVELKIFDASNVLVTKIVGTGVSCPSGGAAGSIAWNGKNGSGSLVPAGIYGYKIQAIDKALNRSAIVAGNGITVDPVNSAPTAAAGPDQDANRGEAVTLNGGASSDPEGVSRTYTWTQVAGSDVTGGTGNLTGVGPTFTAPNVVGTIQFDLRVNDGGSDSLPDRVQINVMEDKLHAFFVSTAGNDSNVGTRSAPFRTIQRAIAVADAFATGDVYVSAGTFTENLNLKPTISLYGGYDPSTWARNPATAPTLITGGTRTVTLNGVSGLTVDGVSIQSANAVPAGESSYGVFMMNSGSITISNARITAGSGAPGRPGVDGADGATGGNGTQGFAGCENSSGLCSTCSRPLGGIGGTSTISASGGTGGRPGLGCGGGDVGGTGAGPLGGLGGAGGAGCGGGNGIVGNNGGRGADGSYGVGGGALGLVTLTGYVPADGANGAVGGNGRGGGAGGGGGGGDDFCDSYGSSGGGGGGGGAGGTNGTAGTGGGGSFGVWVHSSSGIIVQNTVIATGRGGNGGRGGSGGAGGTGGSGGPGGLYGGSSEQDDGGNGAAGGLGGAGGRGGHSGGGGGGPSIGIVVAGSSSLNQFSNLFTLDSPGNGGVSLGQYGSTGMWTSIYP